MIDKDSIISWLRNEAVIKAKGTTNTLEINGYLKALKDVYVQIESGKFDTKNKNGAASN